MQHIVHEVVNKNNILISHILSLFLSLSEFTPLSSFFSPSFSHSFSSLPLTMSWGFSLSLSSWLWVASDRVVGCR